MTTATETRTVRAGDKFRITGEGTGHGFDIGTIVTMVTPTTTIEWVPDDEDNEEVVLASTRADAGPHTQWEAGVTAWIGPGCAEHIVEEIERTFEERTSSVLAAAGETHAWNGRMTTRRCPVAPTRCRVTAIGGSERPEYLAVGDEGWLLQVDTTDPYLTFLVAVDGGDDSPADSLGTYGSPDIPTEPEQRFNIRWAKDVEVLPSAVDEHFTIRREDHALTWTHMGVAAVPQVTVWPNCHIGDERLDSWRLVTFSEPSTSGWDLYTRFTSEHRTLPRGCTDTRGYWVSGEAVRLAAQGPFVEDPPSQVVTDEPAPEPDWTPGMLFRVTSTSGSHGFPVGTIVRAVREVDYSGRNCLDYFHATTLDLPDYTSGARQNIGTTAWVHATGSHMGAPNVEKVDPASLVYPCDRTAHPARAHIHWVRPGLPRGDGMVLHSPPDYTDSHLTRLDDRVYGRGSVVNAVPGTPTDPVVPVDDVTGGLLEDATVPTLDIPPEEVLRLIEDGRADGDYPEERTTIRDLLGQIETARTAVTEARQERAQWLDRLITRAHAVANDEEWCGVFDDGMRELGLPVRGERTEDDEPEREDVTVTASIEVEVPWDRDDFREWFNDNVSTEYDSIDHASTTFTVNVKVDRDFEVNEGDCACRDNQGDWTDYVPGWVHDYEWTITETECGND